MFERNVSSENILALLMVGEIIERYLDDDPCPSCLMLGYIEDIPYHLVLGLCEDHLRLITVYIPEEEQWIQYRKRKDTQ